MKDEEAVRGHVEDPPRTGVGHFRLELPPEARSVSTSRRELDRLLATSARPGLDTDAARVAMSEVVTNAIVHAGAPIVVEAWVDQDGLRVEVADRSPHLPTRREYAVTSGTGRGLQILGSSVDRWGATPLTVGKVVWFELGAPTSMTRHDDQAPLTSDPSPGAPAPAEVTLLNVPLLMVWALQEHAQALLREYLLFNLDHDPAALDSHAEASDALSVLHEQIPVPQLPDDPSALLADTLEPGVSADALQLEVAPASVPHFVTLRDTLRAARQAATRDLFLGPPTQPEISELGDWICDEVTRQAQVPDGPRPWAPRDGVHEPLGDRSGLHECYRSLLADGAPILATDEASIIVAVSPTVLDFLGYQSEEELLGRRVLTVVPHRYHQAHIAGTTLNATNGRDALLDVPLMVPVRLADATEALVELRVAPRRLDDDHRVFVAHFGFPTS